MKRVTSRRRTRGWGRFAAQRVENYRFFLWDGHDTAGHFLGSVTPGGGRLEHSWRRLLLQSCHLLPMSLSRTQMTLAMAIPVALLTMFLGVFLLPLIPTLLIGLGVASILGVFTYRADPRVQPVTHRERDNVRTVLALMEDIHALARAPHLAPSVEDSLLASVDALVQDRLSALPRAGSGYDFQSAYSREIRKDVDRLITVLSTLHQMESELRAQPGTKETPRDRLDQEISGLRAHSEALTGLRAHSVIPDVSWLRTSTAPPASAGTLSA